ncbi:MAG: DUF2339 domain-containing protein [Pseudomonadales bacterium]
MDERLDRIEQRLALIERNLGVESNSTPPDLPATPTSNGPPARADATSVTKPLEASTSTLMAWGAAGSFLLAAGYFVVLAFDSGWLTPMRQVMVAVAAGSALIAGGIWFSGRDRTYAAFMPAVGLVTLYFAIYAGHLYYHLIPVPIAVVAIGGISLMGVGLGSRFANSVFTILAALGVYLTPILIRANFADLVGIVIYFSVWSLLFSFFALQEGRRATYLIALYLALAAFDAAWRIAGSDAWVLACGYQLVQFLIFASTAALFSVRHKQPMGDTTALFHGIPLFYFYGLEYFMLEANAPALVAPAALASVVVVIGLFLLARGRIRDPDSLAASASLVSAYCAFVTAHIVFFELLPGDWLAWGALMLPLALGFAQHQFQFSSRVIGPITLIGGLLFLWGFILSLLRFDDLATVPMPNAALLAYGAVLYAVYYRVRSNDSLKQISVVALYMGHLAVMASTVRFFDSGMTISSIWAVYAVGLLLLALRTKVHDLGQSSLIIFTASAAKVLLYDLADSAPMIRIGTLIVLGGSLYIGGWLYQNLVRETTPFHDDPEIDEQIRLVADLLDQGYDNQRIVTFLIEGQVPCRKVGGWDEALIATIRRDHGLG